MMFARVLVPLDGSALSEQALEYAAAMADRFGAPVTLLFAFEGLDHIAQMFARHDGELDRAKWEEIHRSTDAALAAVRSYLESLAGTFSDRGVAVDTAVVDVRHGSPADAILGEARKSPDTVIVLSTHGRGGIRRIVFGSTAQKVIESSPVPVLVV